MSFKSTHPAAETPLLGCVISGLVCSHLNFQWSCKALTFQCSPFLSALADIKAHVSPCLSLPTLPSSFHCCQLYFQNRSNKSDFLSIIPITPTQLQPLSGSTSTVYLPRESSSHVRHGNLLQVVNQMMTLSCSQFFSGFPSHLEWSDPCPTMSWADLDPTYFLSLSSLMTFDLATLAFLLFIKNTRLISAPRPLHLLIPLHLRSWYVRFPHQEVRICHEWRRAWH